MNTAPLQPSSSALDPNAPSVPVKQEIDDDQCQPIAAQPTPVLEIKSEPEDDAIDTLAFQNSVSQPTVCIKHEPNHGNLNCDCAECRGEVFVKGERIMDDEMIEVQEDDDDHNFTLEQKCPQNCNWGMDGCLEVKSEPDELEPLRTPDYVPLFTSDDDDDDEESTDEQPALPATPALKSHTCQNCSKSFSCLSKLRVHQRTHTGEQPYKCQLCEKSFAQKCNFTQHQRTHTNERPFTCTDCTKSFTTKQNLTRHQLFHTGERPYRCDQCDQKFSQKDTLIIHQRQHTGQRPFKCNQCDKCYTAKSKLNQHLRVHATKNLL